RELPQVAALEEHLASGRAVEGAEELEEGRLAGPARALERDELAGVDCDAHAVDRAHVQRALAVHPLNLSRLEEVVPVPAVLGGLRLHAHSTALNASAGRRRAARKAPAAPARSPPTSASRKPATRISIESGASSLTVSLAVRAS